MGGPWRRVVLLAACVAVAPASALGARFDGSGPLSLPLAFIENRGQADPRVAYYVQGRDTAVFFTARGLTFVLQPGAAESYAVRLDFVDADPRVRPRGADPTGAVVSYFKGNRGDWRSGIPTFSRIVYQDLWPGIDLVYTSEAARMKYSFLVRPGANPRRIRFALRGAAGLAVEGSSGDLVIRTPAGSLRDARPVSFQRRGGRVVEVATAYALAPSSHSYGFEPGPYDPHLPLVIDPAMFVYAGFLGGDQLDGASSVAVDGSGNAYVAGHAPSTEATFPDGDGFGAVPGLDTTYNGGGNDAFVAKVNAAGTALIWAAYLGGDGDDLANDIAIDAAGNAYVTGVTASSEASFPDGGGLGAFTGPDTSYNGGALDAFVAKVNAAGTALVYAGYIGGGGIDSGGSIAVDGAGNAVVVGHTDSTEATFPDGDGFGALTGPDTTYNGGGASIDAFIAKVNASGTGLVYAGYVGGDSDDRANGVAVDAAGAAYLTGRSRSGETTFPDGDGFGALPGLDGSFNGGTFGDAFVVKVSAAGALVYAGYLGGGGEDEGLDIAVDAAGSAYVGGSTSSTQASFPDGDGFGALTGPDVTYNGLSDGFIAKVNPAGSGLVYVGYIGGTGSDSAVGIAVDPAGIAYVTGSTTSTETSFPDGDGLGPLTGPDPTHNHGFTDGFVVAVSSGGTFIAASFIGGANLDGFGGIAVDGAGAVYLAGATESTHTSFPDGDGMGGLPSFDATANGSTDGVLVKLALFPDNALEIPSLGAGGLGVLALLLAASGLLALAARRRRRPARSTVEGDPSG
jgi:beta-propeller repeat-containing protein